ncbi:MAG: efflux RND transporter periplasmic adaptor subunit [Limnobacter sp.]|nr:efflux RND transporter periplasmic adaptor subunit [Limnobacter sp.]
MNEQENQTILLGLMAGRLPCGQAKAYEVVVNHLYALLGTQRVHVHLTEHGGFVYYVAVESRLLTSHSSFKTCLPACFPGGGAFKGDGIYRFESAGLTVALIMENSVPRLLVNDEEAVYQSIAGLDLPAYGLSEEQQALDFRLVSAPMLIQGLSQRLGSWFYRSSLSLFALCVAVYIGGLSYEVMASTDERGAVSKKAVETDLNATLKKISIQQPLARQIARIQTVSSTVIRAGGWIEEYNIDAKGQEQFVLMLPDWVSRDYLSVLGDDIVTDSLDLERLLKVQKQPKKGKP